MQDVTEKLTAAGVRPTRQRELIASHLFAGDNRHFTAEELHTELLDGDMRVSLATIYNTLGSFLKAGLLKTVSVDAGCLYYDTNTAPHYHLYDEDGQKLTDLEPKGIVVKGLPELSGDQTIDRVDIIVRTRPREL